MLLVRKKGDLTHLQVLNQPLGTAEFDLEALQASGHCANAEGPAAFVAFLHMRPDPTFRHGRKGPVRKKLLYSRGQLPTPGPQAPDSRGMHSRALPSPALASWNGGIKSGSA